MARDTYWPGRNLKRITAKQNHMMLRDNLGRRIKVSRSQRVNIRAPAVEAVIGYSISLI
jgi:hypothetical protein